ncbi:hypothetical protein GE061_013295 [Apolygus lucorum]|uniref:Receptor ligand binding region domain-containing protein n=1 Tax=Apolygus lucorum TaxID=248454 RepID=A0A8S9XM97_APOLU|nr:hypothetical protein GE061_013295 [Apolygus lucorum]
MIRNYDRAGPGSIVGIPMDLDTRIIIGSFSQNVARSIFCEAYKMGIYGGDYAWVLQGLPVDGWWVDSERCGQDMLAAMDGVILVTNYKPRIGTIASISGLSSREFEAQMEGRVSGFAYETYDALWAVTLSLVSTLRSVNIVNFDYSSRDFIDHLSKNMASLSFNGVSGPVAFDGPDRIGFSAFYQVQSFGEFVKFQPTSTSAQSISTKNRTRWITPNVYRMVTQTW